MSSIRVRFHFVHVSDQLKRDLKLHLKFGPRIATHNSSHQFFCLTGKETEPAFVRLGRQRAANVGLDERLACDDNPLPSSIITQVVVDYY
jgi:hypothetical protein